MNLARTESVLTSDFLKKTERGIHDLLPGEVLRGPGARGRSQSRAERGVAQKLEQRGGKRGRVFDGNEQPGVAVLNGVTRAGGAGGDDGQRGGRGF